VPISSLEQLQPTYRGASGGDSIPATMGAAALGRPDVERSARAMGATIRALRGHAHISQITLGKRVPMHANYIGAIERGEILNPRLETVDRIAEGLEVSVAVLVESYASDSGTGPQQVDATGGRPERTAAAYDAKVLGAAIRLVRRQLGITQAQLADAIGLHHNHLGSIEAGEKPSRGIATIARVAHELTVKLGADEPPLLPLLAQAFTGEVTLAEVRERFASKPSGPSGAPYRPPSGR
jgi:transcriptional regulator with XRE-family HTH domain